MNFIVFTFIFVSSALSAESDSDFSRFFPAPEMVWINEESCKNLENCRYLDLKIPSKNVLENIGKNGFNGKFITPPLFWSYMPYNGGKSWVTCFSYPGENGESRPDASSVHCVKR